MCVCEAHRLVQMVSHRVRQRSDGVVEDQQVLVLIFPERKHQRVQDEAEVRHQLRARLLFQGCKGAGEREESL